MKIKIIYPLFFFGIAFAQQQLDTNLIATDTNAVLDAANKAINEQAKSKYEEDMLKFKDMITTL
jgi:hypothetical protein